LFFFLSPELFLNCCQKVELVTVLLFRSCSAIIGGVLVQANYQLTGNCITGDQRSRGSWKSLIIV